VPGHGRGVALAFALALLGATPALADTGTSAIAPALGWLGFLVSLGLALRQAGLTRGRLVQGDLSGFAVFVAACWAFALARLGLETGPLAGGLAGAGLAALVVAGALAERIRLVPLLLFTLLLAGAIVPIAQSWSSGGGWLADAGFIDAGGATAIHSSAGWAALAGAIVLGARGRRFDPSQPGKRLGAFALASVGTALVFVGWQGLLAALAGGAGASNAALVHMLLNACLAALTGSITAFAIGYWLDRPNAVPIALNGVIAGLVAISGDPASPGLVLAPIIGGVGGAIAALMPRALERARIDDVTGGVPAHLCAGIWGTLAVALSAPGASILAQLAGIAAVGGFSFIASFILFLALQLLVGLRSLSEQTARA
jgi:Amt family ammonium transporter